MYAADSGHALQNQAELIQMDDVVSEAASDINAAAEQVRLAEAPLKFFMLYGGMSDCSQNPILHSPFSLLVTPSAFAHATPSLRSFTSMSALP